MKAHLVQLDIAWEDKRANHAGVDRLVGTSEVAPGDLLVLPEMFDTGFSFDVGRTADADGETLAFLARLAATRSAFVHGSRTLSDAQGRGRNMATIVGPDGVILAEYEKIHPFSLGSPGEREADHFPGGSRVVTYQWTGAGAPGRRTDGSPAPGIAVCPVICYDLRFPELFRQGLLAGAEMFVVPANWPEARASHFRSLLVARAIENQAYVIGVNRVGHDPRASYHGASVVIDPKGEIVGELGRTEGVLSVEIDPESMRAWRARFPAWRDHRLLRQA